ncbi:MAG: hypothetical protein ACE37B_04825 [Ilumatobacter sp.]|jgi:hypothetical protein|uniref:hypothetical protein n=1 Tax=Ilumatobacter sp. TaxID=1967498 RepID=UPI003919B622
MMELRLRAFAWFTTGVAMALLAGVLVATAWSVDAAPSAQGCSIISLPKPVRILDTRDVVDQPAGPNVGLAGPLQANQSVKLQVSGPITVGALGQQTVIPFGATSVEFNVTVLKNSAGGFVSLRPGDATGVPETSSENVPAESRGSNNFGAVGLSSTGNVDIYYGAAAGNTTDVILDLVRYCATEGVSVPPTSPPSSTTPPSPINVSLRTWAIDWQGNQPGVTSSASNIYDQVRFAISNNVVTEATPGDNGNASDGGNVSYARSGNVCQSPTDTIMVEDGKFGSAPGYEPIGSVSMWEFFNLECNSDATLISGNFRRTDGGNSDTGIFQMYPQGTNVSPLPDPAVPPLASAQSGPTCISSDDLPDTTRTFVFTGAVPGRSPSPDSKININFAVSDGNVTSQSSVTHDGTDPPYTWSNGQILCGARVLNVLMNNNQTTDPAAPDRGKYRFVNVRLDGGDLVGDYGFDREDDGIYEDVGTFRTQ